MTLSELSQLLIAFSTLGTLALATVGYYNLNKGIKEVSHHTNSMKDELVAEVRKSSMALGNLEGRKEIKAEIKKDPKDV